MPKDVGRLGAIFQDNLGAIAYRQSSPNLEDVDAFTVQKEFPPDIKRMVSALYRPGVRVSPA